MARQTARAKSVVPKSKQARATLLLGDLVSEAFDQAYQVTRNHQKAAALAAIVVQRLLARGGRDRYLKTLAAV